MVSRARKQACGGNIQIMIVGQHIEGSLWYFFAFVTGVATVGEALSNLQ